MKTNHIITLGLVAVGAVIVYNKFFKKPKTTSAPADGEPLNAGGRWGGDSPRVKTVKQSGGYCTCFDTKTKEEFRAICPCPAM
jgi:hypothetical protein